MKYAALASFLLLLVLLPGLSCRSQATAGPPSPPAPAKNRVVAGTWGGAHIGLEVTEKGAEVEFDCAHGTIAQPLLLDRQRRFDVKGVYIQEHGGPVREGEAAGGRPARYAGRVDSSTMTLTVTLTDTNEKIGTFTLTSGKVPVLRKCL